MSKIIFDGERISELNGRGFTVTAEGELTAYNGSDKSIVIPDGVTKIGEAVFKGKGITSVVIPDSVTEIDKVAFYECQNLSSVSLGKNVRAIGAIAFARCFSLESLYVPDGVKKLGRWAFASTGIKTLTTGNLGKIGSAVFCDNKNLVSVTLGEGTEEIGNECFADCFNLQAIALPKSLKHIGSRAFGFCTKLKNLDVPEGVTLGNKPFDGVSLNVEKTDETAGFEIKNGVLKDYFGSGLNVKIPECVTKIGKGAFSFKDVEALFIPKNVKEIDCEAFGHCDNLTAVEVDGQNEVYCSTDNCVIHIKTKKLVLAVGSAKIPADGSVTVIGEYAFANCAESLKSIDIPEGITEIQSSAFLSCKNLTEVTLPESLKSIGACAFCGCSFSEIKLGKNITKLGRHAIDSSNLRSLVLPEGIKTLCKEAFSETDIEEIILPDSLKSIGDHAFESCEKLKRIHIPKSVEKIGEGAFFCENLESITVDKENPVYHSNGDCLIKTDEKLLLRACKNSKIPADGSVEVIASYAFYCISGIRNLTIPEGVTTLQDYAFEDCYDLETITLPSTVTQTGQRVLEFCDNLKEVTMPKALDAFRLVGRRYQLINYILI